MQDLTPEPLSPTSSLGGRPLRKVFLDSVQYALGGLAYKAIALISLPILARLVSPAELGLLDLAVIVALVVSGLGTLGLDTALARMDAETPDPDVWASAGVVMIAGLLLVGLVGAVLSVPLSSILLADAEHAGVIASGVLYGCVLGACTMGLNIVRLRSRPRRYATYGFIIVLGEMAGALTLAALGAPVPVIVMGWVLASAIGTAVLFIREHPPIGRPSLTMVKRLLAFGTPLVPAALVWILADVAVRSAVGRELGLDAMGMYGIALRIASVLTLIVAGFALAWHPFLYRSGATEVRDLAYQAAIRLSAALGALAIVLASLAPEVVTVVAGPRYAGAATVVPALALGATLFGMVTLSAAVLGVDFNTRVLAIASGVGAAIQVVCSALLIDRVGLVGAGTATALGYGVTLAAVALKARLPVGRVGLQLVVVIAVLVVLTMLGEMPAWMRFSTGFAGLLLLATATAISPRRVTDTPNRD